MKKYVVLGALFILPIVAYLFFASGVNNFVKLPVLTEGVKEVTAFSSLEGDEVRLQDKITVLGFLGRGPESKKGNAFNINQKIYKRFYQFADFQFVMVLPEGSEGEVQALRSELSPLTDMVKWKFLFGTDKDIRDLFDSLKTNLTLDGDMSTPYVFIIDKDRNLRGRKKDEDAGDRLYGFDAGSVAELNDKMVDDVKVLLAEYRLALKKNNTISKRDSYLKKLK
ncbi:hypothetical protein [Sinomicrobium weinanense]|uniref:Membrane or secreted protein n=1 Tax=Sinomicrobium weinanense TaxID=2842200 RepID=A0A926Q0E1_9FLAO|nr:hypothetical protein [Sinomicrobium weinanense]MBC9794842.1 hypothetical protein [Sinomicrobium weinanense]MBU3125613.1 hypothetical protein [Sinomicrobium weinanense]